MMLAGLEPGIILIEIIRNSIIAQVHKVLMDDDA